MSTPDTSVPHNVTTLGDADQHDKWVKMTGEIAPGRPGNLTPEQEAKLRELWIRLNSLFGTMDYPGPSASKASSINESIEKPKSKSGGWFRRSKEPEPEEDEDKYGQKEDFQKAMKNYSPDVIRASLWQMLKADHPDAILLRFLRARKWDVEKALIMLISTMNWRASEAHIDDDIMLNGEEGAVKASDSPDAHTRKEAEDFITQQRIGKSYMHGTDKEGRPICVITARLHRIGQYSSTALDRYTLYLIETSRLTLNPPVDTACMVFDLSDFGIANMDYAPLKFIVKVFEANYPESLGVVLVHKAPWIFQGFWKVIRGWLDPVVASKIVFTNSVADLAEYIDRNKITKGLGGDEDWEYEYVDVVPGENKCMEDTATRDKLQAERNEIVDAFEKVTLEWVVDPTNNDIKERRHKIAHDLRTSYWKLDPYIRARSFYDRVGILTPGGGVDFYAGGVKSANE